MRSPSSGSVAVAVSVTVVPSSTPDPSAGAESVTFGAPLPTVTVIDAVPVVPRLLVTLAVMRWSPVESVEVLIERPVPIRPSRSDVHVSIGATSPSTLSMAVAVKVAAKCTGKRRPSCGAVMVTAGGRSLTVSCSVATPVRPVEFRTVAVIVCTPRWSEAAVTLPPVPRAPSTLERQVMTPVRSPSRSSRAVAVKVTAWSSKALEPAAGAVIVSCGSRRVAGWPSMTTRCGRLAAISDSRLSYLPALVLALVRAKL